ncbi:MAG: DegT/DnrJ/EryC1/StrS family aminotransferase [Ignavibacteriales bacterium]|nr:DegT/DnrJ/EryC1/StrS family aminotransferase [Ignavibacteriales bacterium]
MNVQMVDVVGQYRNIKQEVDAAIHAVLDSGQYINGKEVAEFEKEVANYLGVKSAVACASGTDALQIAMMALGIAPGDEVITTPFTFVATAETMALLGAKPVYVDIDPHTFNIDPSKIESKITQKTKAIVPVHLYGQAADMDSIMAISRKHGIPVIEDHCQSMGGDYKGTKLGGIGHIAAISFFPSKNLGAFGDGGMMTTNDTALAEKVRVIANHGSRVRYKHVMLGVNSRLDAIQAAILRVKLRHLDGWIAARRRAASTYNRLFAGSTVRVPFEAAYGQHVFHQYTLRLPKRDAVAHALAEKHIPHAIYYPIPLHLQEAYASADQPEGSMPEAELATKEVLSLPMHTELDDKQQQYIAQAVLESVRQ